MSQVGKKEELRRRSRKEPLNCDHPTLVKVEQSDINAIDTDVLLYACSQCKRIFTITDY